MRARQPQRLQQQRGRPIDGARVIFGSFDHHVYALDRQTGRELWNRDLRAEITGVPALVDGRLVVGNRGGILAALDPASGERLWRAALWGSAVESTATPGSGSLFYIGASDLRRVSLICTRARSARALRDAPPGQPHRARRRDGHGRLALARCRSGPDPGSTASRPRRWSRTESSWSAVSTARSTASRPRKRPSSAEEQPVLADGSRSQPSPKLDNERIERTCAQEASPAVCTRFNGALAVVPRPRPLRQRHFARCAAWHTRCSSCNGRPRGCSKGGGSP